MQPRLTHISAQPALRNEAADRARHNSDGDVHYLGQTGQVQSERMSVSNTMCITSRLPYLSGPPPPSSLFSSQASIVTLLLAYAAGAGFRDVVLSPDIPAANWFTDNGCMQSKSDHSPFMYPIHLKDEASAATVAARAALLNGNTTTTVLVAAGAEGATTKFNTAEAANSGASDVSSSNGTVQNPGAAQQPADLAADIAAIDSRMMAGGILRPGAAAQAGLNVTHDSADTVVIAMPPDSGHFQHWLDRTSHVMLQVRCLTPGVQVTMSA